MFLAFWLVWFGFCFVAIVVWLFLWGFFRVCFFFIHLVWFGFFGGSWLKLEQKQKAIMVILYFVYYSVCCKWILH